MKMLSKVKRARRTIGIAILAVSVSGFAMAQEQDQSQRDRGQRDRFMRGQFDRVQMQEMMLQRFQGILGMEDDEWQVVSPLLGKVMQAQGQGRMGGMAFGRGGAFRGGTDGAGQGRRPRGGGEFQGRPPREGRGDTQAGRGSGGGRGGRPAGFGGFGGPGGRGFRGFGPPPSPEMAALNEALESDDTPPDQIRAKLAAVRAARTRQELVLKKAREELRELLTVRQEARLVAMGMLD